MSLPRRQWLAWLALLAFLFLQPAGARATTFARLAFGDLARKARAVARMRCISSESLWEGGEIWTDTQFEVLEAEKGDVPRRVTVRVPGGRVAGIVSRVDGAPQFRPGEEVYLFLWEPAGGAFRVLGWAQGTLRITVDSVTRQERVTQDSSATPVFDPRRGAFRSEGIRNLPVPEFLARLRAELAKTPRNGNEE